MKKELPKFTCLDIHDIRNNSIELYKLKKDEWRFINCIGGVNSAACRGCKYKEECNNSETEEEELLKVYINTFHEPVKGVSDDDTHNI
jgi:hypothetical protein